MSINKLIKILIFIQLLFLLWVFFTILNKKYSIFNAKVDKIIINKDSVRENTKSELKYYYELIPDQPVEFNPESLKKTFTTTNNSDGLNNTKNYNYSKENNVYRIVALGDSYTFGVYVKTEENWPEMLEKKLNENNKCQNIKRFEVLNFGVSGYDPKYEVEIYKRKGQKYNPDLIVWMLIDNIRLNEERGERYEQCDLNEKMIDPKFDCWTASVQETLYKYGKDEVYKRQKENINSIRNIDNKPILFIDYYGTHQGLYNDVKNSIDIAKMLDKKYLLKDNVQKKIEFPDGHPNEIGHKIIADVIYNKLFESNQIPCQKIEQ